MIICPYKSGYLDETLNLLICRPTGELTTDLAHDLAICRECIVKSGLQNVNRFHDLTGITSINLKFDDMVRLCEFEAHVRKPEPPVKAFYLVPNEIVYGTIRMYQALIETRGVDVYVAYDLNEIPEVFGVEALRLITSIKPDTIKF